MEKITDRINEYLNGLSKKFNESFFYDFINDLLNLVSDDIVNESPKNAGSVYKDYIAYSKYYAKYDDTEGNTIGVFIIKLQNGKNTANARTLQRNFIAHLLDYYNLSASIVAIYSDSDEDWRLSFVKQELHISVGKLEKTLTPAKRYSYLFGENEPNHTAKVQLLSLLEDNSKKYSVKEIEDKFSVEKVTKDFFEQYKEKYLELKEMLEKNEEFISESQKCDFTSEEFTKKFMGQLVFIYFLQKKGWLGVKIVPRNLEFDEYEDIYNNLNDPLKKKILDKYFINQGGKKRIINSLLEDNNEAEIDILSSVFVNTKFDEEWGTGTKRFIRDIYTNCINRNMNFFDDYLEPFFYDGLNHKRANQYFSRFNCKVPFLNGGLFEPLDNYQWKVAQFNIANDIFSNDKGTGILDFFEQYNFTIDEEEPLEKDVAVDPEMLGKIFENLLDVKDRKSKGAFYTPREIVHYMCKESLANFLVNKLGVNYEEVKEFIQYGEMIRDVDLKEATKDNYLVGKSIFENITNIDRALENIKIADPAVGSGAFPLGMLNEIVKLRDILTSYMIIYNKLGLWNKKYNDSDILEKRSIYNIKWNTIKNSIYAVDIENSAVDITKLRLWLSIVVDQIKVPRTGPEPLPNLDCKIMQGNSLVDEYEGIKLIDKKLIEELKDRDNIKFNTGRVLGRGRKNEIISENQIEFGDGQKKVQIDDLIRLKQELYETNEPNRKKDLLNKIKTSRRELLKLNFAGTNKENELLNIDNSHNKPYFAWMLEFIEVFIDNDGFDIVIGNPPYVDSEHMVKDPQLSVVRQYCNEHYQSAKGNWDLFIVFVELGFLYLNNYGNESFIIPNKIIASNYAKSIRNIIRTKSLIEVRDYSNVNVFKSAAVYPVTIITNNEKGKTRTPIKMLMMNGMTEINWENEIDREKFDNSENWDSFFAKNQKLNELLINKILLNPKLNELADVKGSATVSEAYIVKEMLYNNADYNKELEFKFINTGTIDRYKINWDTTKTQYIKQSYFCPVLNKQQLKEMSENRYIEACSDKIVIGGMTKILECYLDTGECLAGKSTTIVYNSKINLKYLLGILNSNLITKFYSMYFNSLSLAGGFYRIGAPQIKELPIAKANPEDEFQLIGLVNKLIANPEDISIESELNKLVYKIYNLSAEDIKIMEE